MPLNEFLNLLDVKSECTTKSVFGNTGIFYRGAMFAQVNNSKLLLRGCENLNEKLDELGCQTYVQVKKQSSSNMNYYDISQLMHEDECRIKEFAVESYGAAFNDQQTKQRQLMSRLRDLPNLNNTIERMLKKCGIDNVDCFRNLGAAFSFVQIQHHYGMQSDQQLLWKLHGAICGIHWELVTPHEQKCLIDSCKKIRWER